MDGKDLWPNSGTRTNRTSPLTPLLLFGVFLFVPISIWNAYNKHQELIQYQNASGCEGPTNSTSSGPSCSTVPMTVVEKFENHGKHGPYWFLTLSVNGQEARVELERDDYSQSGFMRDDSQLYRDVRVGDTVDATVWQGRTTYVTKGFDSARTLDNPDYLWRQNGWFPVYIAVFMFVFLSSMVVLLRRQAVRTPSDHRRRTDHPQ